MDKNHILIVEDDADIRSGIEIYLKNQGYDVSQAGDGIEGLAVIEKEEIDLAIVDIMMPRMDGITMMMKVREKGYDFPVIMLSAKSEEVDKIMGLNMVLTTTSQSRLRPWSFWHVSIPNCGAITVTGKRSHRLNRSRILTMCWAESN